MKTPPTDFKTKKNLIILDDCLLTALEQIESGILAVNKVGEIIVFNQAAEAITGFSDIDRGGRHGGLREHALQLGPLLHCDPAQRPPERWPDPKGMLTTSGIAPL